MLPVSLLVGAMLLARQLGARLFFVLQFLVPLSLFLRIMNFFYEFMRVFCTVHLRKAASFIVNGVIAYILFPDRWFLIMATLLEVVKIFSCTNKVCT